MAWPFKLLIAGAQLARNLYDADRARRDAEQRRLQAFWDLDLTGDPEDVAATPRQYVVGTAATPGLVINAADSAGTLEDVIARIGKLRSRKVHSLTLLSAGPLAAVNEVWIDDMLAPLQADAGQQPPVRVWGTKGWTLARSVRAYRYFDLHGAGPLRARFESLRTRMDALVPGWRPAKEGDPLVIPDALDAVTLALFDDLLADYNSLLTSAAFLDWQDRRGADHPVNEPAAWIRLSLGAPQDALPTSAVQAYARANVPGWKSTDTGVGMAWALTTWRYWQDDQGRIRPWSRVPPVRYVATGGGDYDGNPAKLARAIYLQAGRMEADLLGLTDAIDRCAEKLTIEPMTYRRVLGGATKQKLDWTDYRKHLWPDERYPPDQEEQRVNAEVNARVAGATNARPRYGLGMILTSDQINSGEALAIAAERMGGSFVELPGRRISFRPAAPRTAAFASTPATRTTGATVRLGGGPNAPNAMVARIDQDADRLWRASTTPRTELASLVERDGLALLTRRARGVTTQIDAMRQNAYLLDVGSPDKRTYEWAEIARPPAPRAQPGDLAELQHDGRTTTVRIDTVQPQRGRTVYTGREIDADWADDKYFPTPINRDPGPGGPGELDLTANMVATLRETPAGVVCDLELHLGQDVAEIEVEATWRERVASEPPVADVTEHYLMTIPASLREAWFVHTVKDQDSDPPTLIDDEDEDQAFEPAPNRELALAVTTRNGDTTGVTLTGVLLPGTGQEPDALEIVGVSEHTIPDDATAATFEGWILIVVGVTLPPDGTLVYSFDGSTWTAPPHYATTIPSDKNIATVNYVDHPDGRTRRNLVVANTFKLARDQNLMALAARFGAAGAYTYGPAFEIPIDKYVQPADQMHLVTEKPTEDGAYVGQLAYEVEDEDDE